LEVTVRGIREDSSEEAKEGYDGKICRKREVLSME